MPAGGSTDFQQAINKWHYLVLLRSVFIDWYGRKYMYKSWLSVVDIETWLWSGTFDIRLHLGAKEFYFLPMSNLPWGKFVAVSF
jgi:hypothetical protein